MSVVAHTVGMALRKVTARPALEEASHIFSAAQSMCGSTKDNRPSWHPALLQVSPVFSAAQSRCSSTKGHRPTCRGRSPSTSARAGNRRFFMLSALHAHTKAPQKTGLHGKTRRALSRPWWARTVRLQRDRALPHEGLADPLLSTAPQAGATMQQRCKPLHCATIQQFIIVNSQCSNALGQSIRWDSH